MRTLTVLIATTLALTEPIPAAQQRNASSADPVPIVRGQVRSDDNDAAPLRRARVTVSDSADPVYTDSEGRFAIAIPSTGATLRVAKPGFAPWNVRLDASRPDEILIRLPRGAAIVGSVIDEVGGPAVGAGVRVRRVDESTDPGRVPISTATQSDDLGEFRVGSLPEGEYELSVESGGTPSSGFARQRTTVRVSAGEEVGIALIYDARTEDARAAASYAAGYEVDVRSGTGTIAGRVTDQYGRGVAGAIVRLDPAASGVSRMAASNSQGQFHINNVAPGTYRLIATKVGFLPAEHRQERVSPADRVITLRDGHRLDDVDIRLRPGAVVSGRVTDAEGEPLEGLAMHVWQWTIRNGNPVAEPAIDVAMRRTDDRGHYRLHGLQPGTYYVVATDHSAASARAARQVPDAPRSYYPGVRTIDAASTVQVDAGLDAAGKDLTFRTARTSRVRGDAFNSNGQPLNRPVTLAGRTRPGTVTLPPQEAVLDGATFEFQHVVPGAYVLQGIHVVPDPSGPIALESAMRPVTVTASDVELPTFVTSPGSTVSGRIVLEGGGVPPLGGQWLDVMPSNPDDMPHRTPRPWTVTTNTDGTFEITGLQGLMRFVATTALPDGWWLKSVEIDGRDAADIPASFGAEVHRKDVRIVLSNIGAEVSGRVLDGRKEPVATYVAIAFPVDTRRWYPGSRYVRTARPGVEAQFRVGPVPPGDYWIAAVDALDDRSIQDPAALRRLTTVARRVTLSAGQGMVTDLLLNRMGR